MSVFYNVAPNKVKVKGISEELYQDYIFLLPQKIYWNFFLISCIYFPDKSEWFMHIKLSKYLAVILYVLSF